MSQKRFSINTYCEDILDRPKVSFQIREYIEDFVIENILTKKKIIVNSKWNIILAISFLDREYNQGSIDVLPPSTFSDINVKQFTVVAPYKKRLKEGNLSVEFGLYLFEIISVFLIENYKKIDEGFLTSIKKSIDKDYLQTIPYPVDFDLQKYITDNDPNVKNKYIDNA